MCLCFSICLPAEVYCGNACKGNILVSVFVERGGGGGGVRFLQTCE